MISLLTQEFEVKISKLEYFGISLPLIGEFPVSQNNSCIN